MKPLASSNNFISGYVEGYYGKLLTFNDRKGLAESLSKNGATHYLYAPKEDRYHRKEWRKPYPKRWQFEFKGFVLHAAMQGISVVPGVAPGLSFRYRSQDDFKTLFAKIISLTKLGCHEVALLMDDISTELPSLDANAFRNLGEAHGLLLQRLRKKLGKKIKRLWFCPTVYSDYFTKAGAKEDVYLQDLTAHLPADIEVMWTGPAIVSKELTPANLKGVTRVLGRKVLLWDNLYANDYCPAKLFLGPLMNRSKSLRQYTRGLLLNPTGLFQTDCFYLELLGEFNRGTSPKIAWKKVLQKLEIPKSFFTIAHLLASPFDSLNLKSMTSATVQKYRTALKPLIWEWKSPLQLEWYGYLSQLDSDLRLLEASPPDEKWVRKKYSPIIAQTLLNSRKALT